MKALLTATLLLIIASPETPTERHDRLVAASEMAATATDAYFDENILGDIVETVEVCGVNHMCGQSCVWSHGKWIHPPHSEVAIDDAVRTDHGTSHRDCCEVLHAYVMPVVKVRDGYVCKASWRYRFYTR